MHKKFLVARFGEERSTLEAVRAVRSHGGRIYDVFAPYPIHGLDKAMAIRKSRLPWITLAGGTLGLLLALSLQFYAAILDWPMNVGGKPDNSTLAFVPITFELTVLLGGLATVAALFVRTFLASSFHDFIVEGTTEDSFALVLRPGSLPNESAQRILRENGAREVHESEVRR
jgi:Protein of unknown function (DUF3341)